MDIVDGQNNLLPRVATLRSSGRGWVDFTRSINAITLLGRGFGELIQPFKDSNEYRKHWKSVPEGMDYLVACTSMLWDICKKYGDRDSKPLELASGVYWHKPDKLYESCECSTGDDLAPCERVQVLLPKLSTRKKLGEPFEKLDGAVIFGKSKRFPWTWPNVGDPIPGDEPDHEIENSEEAESRGLETNTRSVTENNASSHTSISPMPPNVILPAVSNAEPNMVAKVSSHSATKHGQGSKMKLWVAQKLMGKRRKDKLRQQEQNP